MANNTSPKVDVTNINTRAIFFGALIGVGVWIMLGALGNAIGMSVDPPEDLPPVPLLVLIAVLASAALASSFFVAGYVTSKISRQRLVADSTIHSLSSWAAMAVLLVLLVSAATALDGMKRSLDGMRMPSLVTDVTLMEGQAVTSVKGAGSKPPAGKKATKEDKKSEAIFALAWWVCFASLLLGSGASVAGGLLARKKTSTEKNLD